MSRDDEIYELTKKDQRIFLPGSHKTRTDAVRALLAEGYTTRWEERGDALRPRMGWVIVKNAAGETITEESDDFARALIVTDAIAAWRVLVEAPELDPAFLDGLRDRIVEQGPNGELVPLAAPRTVAGAIALAAAPSIMRAAEQLVRDALARAAPFGAGACPPITWRSSELRGLSPSSYDRSALQPVHRAIIDALGYGVWMGHSHPARELFSFTRYGVDIPNTLQWAANDMGQAMQFDAARAGSVVTTDGVSYADHENPFEPLLRIAHSGVLVQKVTPERVVLVVVDN